MRHRFLLCLLLCLFLPTALFAADITFDAPRDFGVDSPSFIAIGDLNGDGDSDLAVANFDIDAVTILLGDGAGNFVAAGNYGVGNEPSSIAIGDLDGDGDSDLAVVNYAGASISILLNNGDGSFAAAVNYDIGPTLHPSIAIGDLNGDGDLDLAVSNINLGSVSILFGNGDGTFAAAVSYGTGVNPGFVAIGDLDGDGDFDLAVVNNSGSVSILLNNGVGSFAAAVNYVVGGNPTSVSIGDLDGDGISDLAVTNANSNTVSILLGNGDGIFAAAVSYGAGSYAHVVALGDLDGDGNLDLAVANLFGNNVSILKNNGDGTFAAAVNYGVGITPYFVTMDDVDGDGDLDLAVANINIDNVSILLNTTVPDPLCSPIATVSAPATSPTGSYQVIWSRSRTTGVTYTLYEDGAEIYTGTNNYLNVTGRSTGTHDYTVKASKDGYIDTPLAGPASVDVTLTCGEIATFTTPATSTTGKYQVRWSKSSTPGVTYTLYEDGVEIYSGANLYYNVSGKLTGTYDYTVKATKTDYVASSLKGPVSTEVILTCANISSLYSSVSTSTTGSYQIRWSRSLTAGVTYFLYENGTLVYEGPSNYFNITGQSTGSYDYTVLARKGGYNDSALKGPVTVTVN